MRFLVKSGASLKAYDKKGISALDVAALMNNVRALKLFVSLGADINQANPPSKWTPLFYAVNTGSMDTLKALLQMGADPNKKEHKGRSVHQFAVAMKRQDMADLIKRAMASKKR
jgi:uncharacterized protein